MKFLASRSLSTRKQADALVIPFFQVKKSVQPAMPKHAILDSFKGVIATEDFKAELGESQFLYPAGNQEKRIVLLGLGKRDVIDLESLRRAYASLVRACRSKKDIRTLNIQMPHLEKKPAKMIIRGLSEGLFLSNYTFDLLKHDTVKKKKTPLMKSITIIGADAQLLKIAKKADLLSEGVYLARDLVNGNACDVTPQYFVSLARSMARKSPKLKATIFDLKRIKKEGLDLLAAVGQGSACDPAFIVLQYKGVPSSKDHTILVGKGVTYDTGGLNLKPTGSMEDMKCDMGGAATAFGTMQAVVNLNLPVNLSIVVAATENAIGPASYKPGDVFSSYAGTTVEIGNTDAEGRLTLADALAYSVKKLKPTRIFNFATLTGAILVALGTEVTGMMGNDEELMKAFKKAGETTYERVWQLPLHKEYRDYLKSDIADLKNIGGRYGGSITAGAFLKEFVGKIPWVHFDIAGTAYLSKPLRYHPKNATGIGVRLMVEFLENLSVTP